MTTPSVYTMHPRPSGLLFLIVLLLFLINTPATRAQTANEPVSFQGRLTGANGQPVADGAYQVRFRLYRQATGGTALWSESHTVETRGGVFSVLLGSQQALRAADLAPMPFLGLSVDGQELAPRTPLSAVPYALRAGRLDASGLVAGSNVTISQESDGRLQIAATGGGSSGGLSQVTHDATLKGNGTAGSPLGVVVPLMLGGEVQGETGGNTGVLGGGNAGVYGESSDVAAVYGQHSTGSYGTLGSSDYGVYGQHSNGTFGYVGGSNHGAFGQHSNGFYGVLGEATASVLGVNASNPIYMGSIGSGNFGVYGSGDVAGFFNGAVTVLGTLFKAGGSFLIDHPLDPDGKYLSHSFVESPDMMNVYNGNVTTDANGEAIVELPAYFEALNRDFRYQLTAIGQFAQAIVAEEVQGNQFVIRTDKPGVKVSWQVTGIRRDAWAEANRIVVVQDKPSVEQGFYLHPALYSQPQERSVAWARDPALMRSLQEMPRRMAEERQRMEAQRPRPGENR